MREKSIRVVESYTRGHNVHFPVYLWLGPIPVHPHWVFETMGYLVGGWVFI